jgi:hypothetical protein
MIRSIRFLAVLPLLLVLVATLPSAQAQTSPAPGTSLSTTTLLQNASQAFSKGQPVNGVTLTGTANWIAGSDNENGNVTLIAKADGSFQINLELGRGSRTETQTSFANGQQCIWVGSDGISHAIATHNCMLPVTWFLPDVALFGNQQPQGLVAISNGAVSAGINQGIDLRQQAVPNASSADMAALISHLTTVDIYYSPTTYLPSSLAYNIHPDSNAAQDIPVEVIFSNYQTVDGITIPYRIQRFVNGVLSLDIVISEASLI